MSLLNILIKTTINTMLHVMEMLTGSNDFFQAFNCYSVLLLYLIDHSALCFWSCVSWAPTSRKRSHSTKLSTFIQYTVCVTIDINIKSLRSFCNPCQLYVTQQFLIISLSYEICSHQQMLLVSNSDSEQQIKKHYIT